MEQADLFNESIDRRIAQRVRSLRTERQWSLDDLAQRSGVSRASLSRIENGEVSPTAYRARPHLRGFRPHPVAPDGVVEDGFAPVLPKDGQVVWTDPETGFRRRAVSPPAPGLSGEVLECSLKAGTRIAYDRPPRPGLEHHLVLLDGALTLTADGIRHKLSPGDCLRYRLNGASLFETPPTAVRAISCSWCEGDQMIDIRKGGLDDTRVVALLRYHFDKCHEVTPPGSAHVFDVSKLKAADVDFFAAWEGDALLGVGAVKYLDAQHGEVKSMHTAEAARGRGGWRRHPPPHHGGGPRERRHAPEPRTGSFWYFEPAVRLYKAHGFSECPPFGSYRPDPNSLFLTREI